MDNNVVNLTTKWSLSSSMEKLFSRILMCFNRGNIRKALALGDGVNRMSVILKLIGMIIPITMLYASTMIEMGRIWYDDPNYSHGFLIPIISLYILWQRRNILKTIETTSAQIG